METALGAEVALPEAKIPDSYIKRNIREILTLMIVGGGMIYIFCALLVWWITGGEMGHVAAIMTLMTAATGYYYTSSPGSQKRADMMTERLTQPTGGKDEKAS
jgi:hypothetical protein